MQHFKWEAISGFPVSQGSAEALVRWDGKYLLIAYFVSNIIKIGLCMSEL